MKRTEILLLLLILVLLLFGLLIIYDASSYSAFRDFKDQYHYLKEQMRWAVIGFAGLFFFSWFDYRALYKLAIPILMLSIALLILVLVPGIGVQIMGARRWIDTGFFVLQPAEFVKLAFAIYLSAWFSHKEKKRFGAFTLILGIILFLIMLEPDMGTAVILLFESLIIYFLSGGNIMDFAILVPFVFGGGMLLIFAAPYRLKRLTDFFNFGNLEEKSYHVKQILIAFGSGGLTGVGIGNSLQKYAYLPETTTDSIFAIIGEEFGFIGATLLIFLFIAIIFLGFHISSKAKDAFGKLLAAGLTSFLAIQMIVNLGAQTALFPLTGVPLPFISYGGSALIVNLCSIGILLNISRKSRS